MGQIPEPQNNTLLAEEQRQAKERDALLSKYRTKGFQVLSYKEYQHLKTRQGKARKFSLPLPVTITFSTPVILVACFGVFFIPFVLFLIATGKPVKPKSPPKVSDGTSYEDLLKPTTPE